MLGGGLMLSKIVRAFKPSATFCDTMTLCAMAAAVWPFGSEKVAYCLLTFCILSLVESDFLADGT